VQAEHNQIKKEVEFHFVNLIRMTGVGRQLPVAALNIGDN